MSGPHYSIRSSNCYFLTSTVKDWIDVFTRKNHKLVITDALAYCQQEKGLIIYAWCLMPSHLHLLAGVKAGFELVDIMRDFKKYTAKKILKQIAEEPESRREWMLDHFMESNAKDDKLHYTFWQPGNHAIELYSPEVTWQKIKYIHQNPVEEMFVSKEEDYYFSSARNYCGLKGEVEVTCLTPLVESV